MKIYVKDQIIDIRLLKDLKERFTVVFEDDRDIKLKLNGNIVSINSVDMDCSHWIEKIKEGNTELSLSELIDRILIEFTSTMDIII